MVDFPSSELEGVICEQAFNLVSPKIQVFVHYTKDGCMPALEVGEHIIHFEAYVIELPILIRFSECAHKYTEEHTILVTYWVNILPRSRRGARACSA